jgi:phosphoribosylaminoimidazolecarboxamide formyltransferase / IMP cyclohydrolase
MIAVSGPVDEELARFVTGVVADGIVAPGFAPGTVAALAAKKGGGFLVLAADPGYEPPEWEERSVFGVRLAQQRDAALVTADLLELAAGPPLGATAVPDALAGLVTARYTQSNSVVLMQAGAAIGIAAGQQNRVDCVQLAARKAAIWWLRRHPAVDGLPVVAGMPRQDRLNWQIRLAAGELTPGQSAEFGRLFAGATPPEPSGLAPGEWPVLTPPERPVLTSPERPVLTRRERPVLTPGERSDWLAELTGLVLVSDGYLPFRDNVDVAHAAGVSCVVEPGGSSRSAEVAAACAEHGMTLVRTGLRLFRH